MTDREKAESFTKAEFENPDLVADTYDRQEIEKWFAIAQFPRTLTDNQWKIVREWCNGEDYETLSDLHAVMYDVAKRMEHIESDYNWIEGRDK
jgi:hypothetical protein